MKRSLEATVDLVFSPFALVVANNCTVITFDFCHCGLKLFQVSHSLCVHSRHQYVLMLNLRNILKTITIHFCILKLCLIFPLCDCVVMWLFFHILKKMNTKS